MGLNGDVIKESQIPILRQKYGNTTELNSFTLEAAKNYEQALAQNIESKEEDDDDLPF